MNYSHHARQQVSRICYSHDCTFVSFSQHLPVSPIPGPLVSTTRFYFCEFDILFHIKIKSYGICISRPGLLDIMSSGFTSAANGKTSFSRKDWCPTARTHHAFFIPSSVREQMGCFLGSALLNDVQCT